MGNKKGIKYSMSNLAFKKMVLEDSTARQVRFCVRFCNCENA